MKFRHLLTTLFLLLSVAIFAQNAPSGINYQAVARDGRGQVLTNKTIGLQINLYAGEVGGKAAYSEIHRIQTNELGLFSLVIGKGEVIGGDFQQVPWSTMNVWMELAMDENGGKDFQTINASQLMAVPYAFHAATAGDLANGHNDDGTEKTAAFWKVNGNELTFPGPHFIGTLDAKDFVFKTTNLERMRITAAGDINISNTLNVGVDINVGRDANIGRNLDVNNNANIDNDLTVGGIARFNNTTQSTTKDNGAVIVEGGVGIEKNLNVGGNTSLGGTLDVGGVLTVTNTTESTTKDNGALVVEGGAGIEKNLNVGGNSGVTGNSTVGGTLGVNGIATFNNTTQSTTKDNGAVVVEGGVGIEKNLNVGGNSAVTGNSTVGGNTTTTGNTTTSTLNVNTSANIKTKLVVDGNNAINGGEGSSAAYPLVVQGSNQGIWVNINTGRNSSTNFVTFADNGGVQGAIEGLTTSEVLNSFEYIWGNVFIGLQIGFISAEAICTGTQLDLCEAGALAAQAITLGIELAAFNAEMVDRAGVAYESGGADYAEWLERANLNDKLHFGEIVGVRGGKISRNTADVDHYMVVSMSPIVLGNSPKGNPENYEKVAFMGQVPVRVIGKAQVGDYILPSGNNDGYGIAVSPKDMKVTDYRNVVGMAWSDNLGDLGGYVNVAIGLNANSLADQVIAQQRQIEDLSNKLNQVIAHLNQTEGTAIPQLPAQASVAPEAQPVAPAIVETAPAQDYSDRDFDQWLEEHRAVFEQEMAKVKANLAAAGSKLDAFPEMKFMVDNPVEAIKQMRDDANNQTLSAKMKELYLRSVK